MTRQRLVLPLMLLLLTGCSVQAASPTEQAPGTVAVTQVIASYELFTHCGVREAKVGEAFYVATPQLDDGNGNPPTGWGNPSQVGTMTQYDNGTARFTAGELVAVFAQRARATDWLETGCQ